MNRSGGQIYTYGINGLNFNAHSQEDIWMEACTDILEVENR